MGKTKGFPFSQNWCFKWYRLILEKEREENEKNKQVEAGQPSTETSTKAIVQAMSQVSWRDEEIKGLKTENQRLVDMIKKKEEEKRFFESKNKEFLKKNEKLAKKVSGQLRVQGDRHLIWDMIITKATKMRPYLNFIKDKEVVINVARQSCVVVK